MLERQHASLTVTSVQYIALSIIVKGMVVWIMDTVLVV